MIGTFYPPKVGCSPVQMVTVAGMPLKYSTIDVETMGGGSEAKSDSGHPSALLFLACTAHSLGQLLSPLAHDMSADFHHVNRFTIAYLH